MIKILKMQMKIKMNLNILKNEIGIQIRIIKDKIYFVYFLHL